MLYLTYRTKKNISYISILINIVLLLFLLYLRQFYNHLYIDTIIIILLAILPITSSVTVFYLLQNDVYDLDINNARLLTSPFISPLNSPNK